MTVQSKIMDLQMDEIYQNLLKRFDAMTIDILNGAGNDEDWITLFQQIRQREAEVLGL